MRTLADLKRNLKEGVKVTLIGCDRADHKYLNVTRAVEKVQTNAIKFEGGSWLEFGKAKDYEFYGKVFKQYFGYGWLEYRIEY